MLLFDKASPNYTTVLRSQVSVTYNPNGSDAVKTAYIKNLGWHFARYNNIAYADDPLYCIEPYKNYAASTSGNSVDRDVTLTGSGSTAPGTFVLGYGSLADDACPSVGETLKKLCTAARDSSLRV